METFYIYTTQKEDHDSIDLEDLTVAGGSGTEF